MKSLKQNNRKISFETLESRRLLAAILESEPNGSKPTADSALVTSGEDVHLLGAANKRDSDFFAVTFANSGVYSVGTGAARVKLDVENRLGVKLLETQPKDGISAGTVSVIAGDRLWFRVRGLQNSAAAYDVAIGQLTSPSSPAGLVTVPQVMASALLANQPLLTKVAEVEFNGTKSTANAAQVSATGAAHLTGSANKQDKDFFAVTFATAGSYKIDTGTSRVKLDVENQLGAKLLDTEPKDGLTSGVITVKAGEKLWFRVRGIQNDASAYAVSIEKMT